MAKKKRKAQTKEPAKSRNTRPKRDESFNLREILVMSMGPACAPTTLEEILVLADALSALGHQADIHTEAVGARWKRSGEKYLVRVVSVLAAFAAMESAKP